jgi:site-specific recombinase XerD
MVRLRVRLSQAIEGFFLEKRAAGRSRHTLADYENAFRHFREYLQADPWMDEITVEEVRQFLARLGSWPVRSNGGVAPDRVVQLSKKSIYNVHTALSSLWSWAVREGYATDRVMDRVARPRPEERAIVPYSQGDVERMLAATESMAAYERGGVAVKQARPTALRDQAIILLLLDTGLRASELCGATVGALDLQNQRLRVMGKGSRERVVALGVRTCKALWRYLALRQAEGKLQADEPLFTAYGRGWESLSRNALGKLKLIRGLGDASEVVPRAGVHRFRHTFAIAYLRNGGDVYTLQRTLGHSSLEMVRRYLALAQADVEAAHRRASPVDRWRL